MNSQFPGNKDHETNNSRDVDDVPPADMAYKKLIKKINHLHTKLMEEEEDCGRIYSHKAFKKVLKAIQQEYKIRKSSIDTPDLADLMQCLEKILHFIKGDEISTHVFDPLTCNKEINATLYALLRTEYLTEYKKDFKKYFDEYTANITDKSFLKAFEIEINYILTVEKFNPFIFELIQELQNIIVITNDYYLDPLNKIKKEAYAIKIADLEKCAYGQTLSRIMLNHLTVTPQEIERVKILNAKAASTLSSIQLNNLKIESEPDLPNESFKLSEDDSDQRFDSSYEIVAEAINQKQDELMEIDSEIYSDEDNVESDEQSDDDSDKSEESEDSSETSDESDLSKTSDDDDYSATSNDSDDPSDIFDKTHNTNYTNGNIWVIKQTGEHQYTPHPIDTDTFNREFLANRIPTNQINLHELIKVTDKEGLPSKKQCAFQRYHHNGNIITITLRKQPITGCIPLEMIPQKSSSSHKIAFKPYIYDTNNNAYTITSTISRIIGDHRRHTASVAHTKPHATNAHVSVKKSITSVNTSRDDNCIERFFAELPIINKAPLLTYDIPPRSENMPLADWFTIIEHEIIKSLYTDTTFHARWNLYNILAVRETRQRAADRINQLIDKLDKLTSEQGYKKFESYFFAYLFECAVRTTVELAGEDKLLFQERIKRAKQIHLLPSLKRIFDSSIAVDDDKDDHLITMETDVSFTKVHDVVNRIETEFFEEIIGAPYDDSNDTCLESSKPGFTQESTTIKIENTEVNATESELPPLERIVIEVPELLEYSDDPSSIEAFFESFPPIYIHELPFITINTVPTKDRDLSMKQWLQLVESQLLNAWRSASKNFDESALVCMTLILADYLDAESRKLMVNQLQTLYKTFGINKINAHFFAYLLKCVMHSQPQETALSLDDFDSFNDRIAQVKHLNVELHSKVLEYEAEYSQLSKRLSSHANNDRDPMNAEPQNNLFKSSLKPALFKLQLEAKAAERNHDSDELGRVISRVKDNQALLESGAIKNNVQNLQNVQLNHADSNSIANDPSALLNSINNNEYEFINVDYYSQMIVYDKQHRKLNTLMNHRNFDPLLQRNIKILAYRLHEEAMSSLSNQNVEKILLSIHAITKFSKLVKHIPKTIAHQNFCLFNELITNPETDITNLSLQLGVLGFEVAYSNLTKLLGSEKFLFFKVYLNEYLAQLYKNAKNSLNNIETLIQLTKNIHGINKQLYNSDDDDFDWLYETIAQEMGWDAGLYLNVANYEFEHHELKQLVEDEHCPSLLKDEVLALLKGLRQEAKIGVNQHHEGKLIKLTKDIKATNSFIQDSFTHTTSQAWKPVADQTSSVAVENYCEYIKNRRGHCNNIAKKLMCKVLGIFITIASIVLSPVTHCASLAALPYGLSLIAIGGSEEVTEGHYRFYSIESKMGSVISAVTDVRNNNSARSNNNAPQVQANKRWFNFFTDAFTEQPKKANVAERNLGF